jgi:hypothetical protein
MVGTLLNVLLLALGATVGLATRKEPSDATQNALKIFLGVFTVWTGLSILWRSIHGTFGQILGQLGIALLALSLGHATGKLARLQLALNHLGRIAKLKLADPPQPTAASRSNVFLGCTILCVANPLGLFGALLEGVSGHWEVLAIKAVMDGLSCLAFARIGGWPVLGAALPVLAFQGTISLLAQAVTRHALSPVMIDSIGATGGLLVFSVSLIIFSVRRVELANYLPAFIFAPLLAWWWR